MAPAIIKEYLQLHSRLMFMMVKTKEFTPGRFDAASNLFLALGKKFFSCHLNKRPSDFETFRYISSFLKAENQLDKCTPSLNGSKTDSFQNRPIENI